MFGLHSDIRRIYDECKDRPWSFQSEFGRKISTMMKSSHPAKYDYSSDKIVTDIRLIGDECKKRGYSTKRFLQLVKSYCLKADRRLHQQQVVNMETLELEFYIGECQWDAE